MTVKIDKYEMKCEKSPKIFIYDNKLQMHICSVNTPNKENNVRLAQMILNELNTGNYEEEEI